MAIKLGDNLDYRGPKPDIARQQYETIADMKNVADNKMPALYLAYCLETEKVYLYRKSNEVDETYGKFREFSQSSGGDSSQVTELPAPSSFEYDKVYQYVGPTTQFYTQGYFYHCTKEVEEEETIYYWEHLSTGEVRTISSEDIAYIFENELQ